MSDLLLAGTVAGSIGLTAGLGLGYMALRAKGLHRWILSYLKTAHLRKNWRPGEKLKVYLLVCDHYEPKRGGVSRAVARQRVQDWLDRYPKLFDKFRDIKGKPPQHTFFYPQDEYEPEYVDMVASLCRQGYGDVEVHLHHDHDTPAGLTEKLVSFKNDLYHKHQLLRKDPVSGEITYGFIHGNWALDNSRSDRRWCGVDNELEILEKTGCYADFTMPSAPDETQTRIINSIYWAKGQDGRRKSHNGGTLVSHGPKPDKALLMVQGPLLLDWSQRKWRILPRIENGNLQKNQPPSEKRLDLWTKSRIIVPYSNECVLVKLHTHGVNEPNQDTLLGPAMEKFHQELQQRHTKHPEWEFEYVTAYEAVQLILDSNNKALTLESR